MLLGTFEYNGYALRLRGHDISGTFYLEASGENKESVDFFDEGIYTGDEHFIARWRYGAILMTIGPSKIKVQEFHEEFGTSKIKNDINREAFAELGSIIRGMKDACTPKNREESGSFESNKEYSYTIGDLGTAKLTQGALTELSYDSGDGVTMELKTVRDDGKIVEYFKNGHQIVLDVDKFVTAGYEEEDFGVADLEGTASDDYYTVEQIIQQNPHKSFDWLRGRNYNIVGQDDLEKVCRRILKYGKNNEVVFDTETTGLNINFRSKEGFGDVLVGMVFTIKDENNENETYYFPVRHQNIPNIAMESKLPYVMEKYIKVILETTPVIVHNASFDWKVMYSEGINTNIVGDTLTLARLTIGGEDTNFPLGLKKMAYRLLGRDSLELDDFVEGSWGNRGSFDELPYESVKYYACADTDNTMDIHEYYKKDKTLRRYSSEKVYEIEVMFSRAIGYSEYYGMYADPDDIDQLTAELERIYNHYYSEMVKIVGHDFNPRSSKQLTTIMYDELGIEIIKYTASGNPSADKGTLSILASKVNPDGSPLYPFVENLQKYRDAANLKSNFSDPFYKLSNDGFFHSNVQQFLETGRVSVNNPNYQSFNDVVKKHIIPREGYYMFDSDFSSVEYRVLVSIANEESLIEQFYDPDFDYHRRMASLLHGVPYESVTPELRSNSKGLNFGIPYGMTVVGLAERMFGDNSDDNVSKASRLYNKYFDVQPNVKKFFENTKDFAVENSYNSTFFGRRRYYNSKLNKVGRIRRQAGNHPIQGTAADLYKLGIGRLFLEIFKRGYEGKLLIDAFVHDEVVLEVHKSINPAELLTMVSKAMMPDIDGWCPLFIGAGFGANWYEAKDTELPVQVQKRIIDSEGLDFWEGDVKDLVDWEIRTINNYSVERVFDCLKNENNWGTNFPPAELGFFGDSLSAAVEGTDVVEGLEEQLDEVPSDFNDQLEAFGRVYGCSDLIDQADIQEASQVKEEDLEVEEVSPEDVELEYDMQKLLLQKTSTFGAVLDRETKTCIVSVANGSQAWIDYLAGLASDTNYYGGEYALNLYDGTNILPTSYKVGTSFVSTVIRVYGRV